MRDAPRILLLEDDEGNALTMSALLEDEGFVVHVFGRCADARLALASPEPFAAVLLDRGLPDGDGAELAALSRARQPSARVIVLSGAASSGHDATIDAFVAKGSGIDAVLRAMRSPGPGAR